MEDHTFTLPTKPGASLRVSIFKPPKPNEFTTGPNPVLLVFLNGLGLPRASWAPAIKQLMSLRCHGGGGDGPTHKGEEEEEKEEKGGLPAMLTYDRYGQADSDPDPADPPDTPYGHEMLAVVADLHELIGLFQATISTTTTITTISTSTSTSTSTITAISAPSPETPHLILVCNSIGCSLARLYAAAHPGRVAAMLLLDSMLANSDYVSVFPDPDAPSSSSSSSSLEPPSGPPSSSPLPPGVTADDLRHARDVLRRTFHPHVPNRERLDRRNAAALLPWADAPVLAGLAGGGGEGERKIRLVVVGHDPDAFAEQTERDLKIPKALSNTYTNPAWAAYNDGLTRIGGREEDFGRVTIAKGCGHFIQRDNPAFVAREMEKLLDAVVAEDRQPRASSR